MRVLFVDDEDRVLAGIERTLFMADRDWEVDFATSGAEALGKLAIRPADVVVSDMRMPLMDGAELMRQVRDSWPNAIRIILSGETDHSGALHSLEVAHQFLAKPCDGDTLIETIDRAVSLQALLQHQAVQAVVGRIGSLPAAPRMYLKLSGLLRDGNAGIGRFAEIVRGDPALAAKVLQLANCAFFRSGHQITSIPEAVTRIGLDTLRAVVLTTEIARAHAGVDADAVQSRAFRASCLAAEIGGAYAPVETVAAAALLAEIGLLVPQVQRLCEAADTDGQGFPSHAEVGAYLLGLWGLPWAIVEAVAHHLQPARGLQRRFGPIGVVHVAVALSQDNVPDEAFLQQMGVAEHLDAWRNTCAANAFIGYAP